MAILAAFSHFLFPEIVGFIRRRKESSTLVVSSSARLEAIITTYIPNLTHLKDVAEFPEAHKDTIDTLLPSTEI